MVTAPSGFGKTTLLRTWTESLQGADQQVVWVTLSTEVTTRLGFWQRVAASATRRDDVDPTIVDQPPRSIDTDDPVPAIAELLGTSGSTLVIVDAYEHLRSLTSAVDDDIVRLLAAAPGLEVVVATRAATQLAGDLPVIRGLVRVIGEDDLRFTAEEVARLVVLQAPHALAAAERITHDTRGYPLGVRAAVRALDRVEHIPAPGSAAWSRVVSVDLASQLDPSLAGFVLDTSVPPYVDRWLARELSGWDDVEGAFDDLTWQGFGRWLPDDGSGDLAFEYAESAREVFAARLRADRPARYERNARLAAAWLHRQNDNDRALELALDARDYDLASSICGRIIAANPHFYVTDALERHVRRVPRSQLARLPLLAFVLGMTYATNPATRESAAGYLRLSSRRAPDGPTPPTLRAEFAQCIRREVSLRYLGRGQEAGAVALEGLALLDSMSADEADRIGEFLAMALSLVAYSAFQAGEVARASAAVDRAVTAATTSWWRSYALGFALAIHALDGRHDIARAAETAIDDDVPRPDQVRLSPYTLGALGKAALRLDEFRFGEALDELALAEPQTEADDTWPFIMWVAIYARLGLGDAGAEARRVELALASRPRIGLGSNLGTAAVVNGLAILWLANGRADKGRPLLRGNPALSGQLAPARLLYQLGGADPAGPVRSVAELLSEPGHTVRSATAVETLGAAAALRAGNDSVALELLARAAARYELCGVRAHLLYVPGEDLDALRRLAASSRNAACDAYLSGHVPSPIVGVDATAVALTRRELAVLRAWAVHRTRAEVADALFVSANTVRSQLTSAYRKLGATTKDAAIQRALELDLL